MSRDRAIAGEHTRDDSRRWWVYGIVHTRRVTENCTFTSPHCQRHQLCYFGTTSHQVRRNHGPNKACPWTYPTHVCLDRHPSQESNCPCTAERPWSPVSREDSNFRGLCYHFCFLGTVVFVMNIAKGPFNILPTAPVYMHM